VNIALEELTRLTEEIRKILKARAGRPMTEAEFRQQKISFVVGNAFDAFSDKDIIDKQFMERLHKKRLEIAR
jgi:hypothetical protein